MMLIMLSIEIEGFRQWEMGIPSEDLVWSVLACLLRTVQLLSNGDGGKTGYLDLPAEVAIIHCGYKKWHFTFVNIFANYW